MLALPVAMEMAMEVSLVLYLHPAVAVVAQP